MNEETTIKGKSISLLPSLRAEEGCDLLPGSAVADATKSPEKVADVSNFSCEGFEVHEEVQDRSTQSQPDIAAAVSLAKRNPQFDITTQSVENQFNCIEREFAAVEARTMNPRQYNFTTSYAFPTKNRYINVMANEETLFPPPKSPLAVRSSGKGARSTGQRILDTLRGSTSPADNAAPGPCEDVSSFKTNTVTSSGKHVPLYFNANILDMGVGPIFVASQAPVLDCIEDFLNTIYNYKIPLILMLTELEEGGFVKAERYWPADHGSGLAGEVFGNMAVYKDLSDPYSVDAKHELIFRPFFIRPCSAPKQRERKVTMVQYVGWPDRGVPDSTESFEELLRIIDDQSAMSRASSASITSTSAFASASPTTSSPTTTCRSSSSSNRSGSHTSEADEKKPSVLVHCSAGIGRTGTLIGAYTAIKLMEIGKLNRDSIQSILLVMRKARFGMVQRIEQYMFLYLIVLQHLAVDTTQFAARMQPRADLYNYRWMEARQAAMAARAARQQQQ